MQKGKYELAHPVDHPILDATVDDMERMYAVVSVHVSFPDAEKVIRAAWDSLPESA